MRQPSLTIVFVALRHFPWLQVPAYFALKGIFHSFLSGGITVPNVTISTTQAFFTEFIVSFNLLFVVTTIATDTRTVRTHASILDRIYYT
jgi:aquaporin NIP